MSVLLALGQLTLHQAIATLIHSFKFRKYTPCLYAAPHHGDLYHCISPIFNTTKISFIVILKYT